MNVFFFLGWGNGILMNSIVFLDGYVLDGNVYLMAMY
jgi:hypothetical protein